MSICNSKEKIYYSPHLLYQLQQDVTQ